MEKWSTPVGFPTVSCNNQYNVYNSIEFKLVCKVQALIKQNSIVLIFLKTIKHAP